jgi:hypothetical protein
MHRSKRVTRSLVVQTGGLLFLVIGLNGCFLSRSPPEDAATADSAPAERADLRNAEVTIMIHNHHWLDLNIYLVRGPVTERLATATGLTTKVISLPWRRVEGAGTIRLGADPIGQNRGVVTETIVVRPSSVVEWTIESGLRGFFVSVF